MIANSLERFLSGALPKHDDRQQAMLAHANALDFPTIGRKAGCTLASLAAARQATRVFEFGSGFGYSASWFLRGMKPGGTIVLTEIGDELENARRFLAEATDEYEIRFERGDALETIERYDGPFDIVLIDHEKEQYDRAFELVVDKMAPGGVIVADNVLDGPVHYEEILPYFENNGGCPDDPTAAGIVSYLRTVTTTPGVTTTILPVDEGLAVSAIDPERF